tara:strand:+ start:419 stop:646 length:228 start_codon:yes stop_codon:yes gene_type:complete
LSLIYIFDRFKIVHRRQTREKKKRKISGLAFLSGPKQVTEKRKISLFSLIYTKVQILLLKTAPFLSIQKERERER